MFIKKSEYGKLPFKEKIQLIIKCLPFSEIIAHKRQLLLVFIKNLIINSKHEADWECLEDYLLKEFKIGLLAAFRETKKPDTDKHLEKYTIILMAELVRLLISIRF